MSGERLRRGPSPVFPLAGAAPGLGPTAAWLGPTAAWLVLLALLLHASPADAQAPPIEGNDYRIDLTNTAVLGSGRIVGLGGAYTAIAEGIDGAPWNPVAYASRTHWEEDYFEWELTASILFPGSFSDNDFFNTGRSEGFRFDRFLFVNAGLRLQWGDTGLGILTRSQIYRIGEVLDASFHTGHYGIARQLLDGQVLIGVGLRTASFDLTRNDTQSELVSFDGTGPEVGLMLRLADEPWRIGVAARSPVRSGSVTGSAVTECGDALCAGEFVLPRSVHMPWEVQVGAALQLGDRPLNARWRDPREGEWGIARSLQVEQWRRERAQVRREMGAEAMETGDPYRWLPRRAQSEDFWYDELGRRVAERDELEARIERYHERREAEVESMPRFYVLLTADLIVTGPTEDGVGVEGFLAQRREPSGRDVSVGVRVGAEVEPWTNRLKLRAGSYLEPSRFETEGYRVHVTGGFDLRLFEWDLFGLVDAFDVRVGATADRAPRYFDWGFGIGFWH